MIKNLMMNDRVKLFTCLRENIRFRHTENAAVIGVKLKVCGLGDSGATVNILVLDKLSAILETDKWKWYVLHNLIGSGLQYKF